MPEVIFRKFIISILIGAGCLCSGIIGKVAYHDTRIVILSALIFVGMMVKAGMIYYRFKKGKYTKITGRVISISRQLFASNKNIEVETDDGTIKLYLPKDIKIKPEKTYCFYFVKDTAKTPVIVNDYITAKLNTDNFIGCEEIADDKSDRDNEKEEYNI